jgi:hypothetical protein
MLHIVFYNSSPESSTPVGELWCSRPATYEQVKSIISERLNNMVGSRARMTSRAHKYKTSSWMIYESAMIGENYHIAVVY